MHVWMVLNKTLISPELFSVSLQDEVFTALFVKVENICLSWLKDYWLLKMEWMPRLARHIDLLGSIKNLFVRVF